MRMRVAHARMLEVARNTVFRAVAAARMDLVALDLPDLASSQPAALTRGQMSGMSGMFGMSGNMCLGSLAADGEWEMRTGSRLLVGSAGGA